jgi:hypothetical protein
MKPAALQQRLQSFFGCPQKPLRLDRQLAQPKLPTPCRLQAV